jgi:hypothetical protein
MGELPAATRGRRLDAEPAGRSQLPRRRDPRIRARPERRRGRPGHRRAILARVELTRKPSDALNTCFLVGEGEIDEDREEWWLDVFVCVNEQAQGPPAIGDEPPERYRI